MKKMITLAAMVATLTGCIAIFSGCSTLSVENRGVDEKGQSRGWCVTRKSNMIKQDLTDFEASINPDGTIGVKFGTLASAPSEEFAKSLMTFAYVARIAAAMYSPGAATVPLSSEAADPQALAAALTAQANAQATTIKAKSDAATAKIQAEAAAKSATSTCTDGNCDL